MIDIHLLKSESTAGYKAFVPKELLCCLEGIHPLEISTALMLLVGASIHGTPIGIGIASVMKYTHQVDIHHLFVLPEYRQQHIGTALFDRLLEEAKRLGGRSCFLSYPLGQPSTSAIEKIFLKAGWMTRPLLIRCTYDVLNFYMPWATDEEYPYPEGYEEIMWKELSDEEKELLRRRQEQGAHPFYVSPFIQEERIEPLNSLVLRYQGEMIGWMMTHRIDVETIRYTTLYVERHVKHRGWVMAQLLSHSMRRHLAQPTPWAILDIPLLYVSSAWLRFAEKRLFPYAATVVRYNEASTVLL